MDGRESGAERDLRDAGREAGDGKEKPAREALGGAERTGGTNKMERIGRRHGSQDDFAGFAGVGLAWPDTTPAALETAADVFRELVAMAARRSPEHGLLLAADGSPAEAIDLACELNRPLGEVREAMGILEARGLIESEPCAPTPETARGARR